MPVRLTSPEHWPEMVFHAIGNIASLGLASANRSYSGSTTLSSRFQRTISAP